MEATGVRVGFIAAWRLRGSLDLHEQYEEELAGPLAAIREPRSEPLEESAGA